MTRRKVLFLIESLGGGGAEKVLTTLVQHINKKKFEVTVCAISGGGEYMEIVKENVAYKSILNVSRTNNILVRLIYTIKHHLVYKWLPLSWVYRLFVPQGSDVEVAYVEGFTTKLLSHSINKNAKKYAWVHIDLFQNHWTRSVYKNREEEINAYNRYDRVFGVSKTVKDAFMKAFPTVFAPVSPMYNPINSYTIIDMASIKAKETAHPIRLVTVGRLELQKGYDRLVRVINQLKIDGFALELWILGTGSQEDELKWYIQNNHLENSVKLLGFKANPYKYMAQGDLFVCSSRSEGYSTAVTEALILGIPVITTDCSGMAELLKNGECGIITENDEDAFYKGLKKLLEDSSLLDYYRLKAVERGKDFTIESLMEPIEKLLLE